MVLGTRNYLRARIFLQRVLRYSNDLGSFPANAASQLDVLGHDGHTLGVDGAQVRVFEQANQVRLAGLLEGSNSGALEPEIGFEVLSDLPDEPLEGELANEQLC